jgi:aspartyl-tRNA(Asn)/glutamyl-tRNA(Gln) amidotransferase subunit C
VNDLVNEKTLVELSTLAALPFEPEKSKATLDALNEVLALVGQMQSLDVSDVAPLAHPLERHQTLRADAVTETIDASALSQNAPLYEAGLYFVPKVIE